MREPGLVKIIAVPEGDAPKEIREAWVGLDLPYEYRSFSEDADDLSDEGVKLFRINVRVPQKEAIEALEKKAINKELSIAKRAATQQAVNWWKGKGFPKVGRYFSFGINEVEVKKQAVLQ